MSSTHPPAAVWRALLPRLGFLLLAIAVGLALHQVLSVYLAQIGEDSKTDLLGARRELARVFELLGLGVFGLTGATGVAMVLACRRAAERAEFPPPGMWSVGGARRVTGPRAQLLARVGMGLGAAVVAASAAGGGLAFYAASVLRACRAGVAP